MKIKFKRNYNVSKKVVWSKWQPKIDLGAPLKLDNDFDYTIDAYKLHLALLKSIRHIMVYSKTTRKKIKRSKV